MLHGRDMGLGSGVPYTLRMFFGHLFLKGAVRKHYEKAYAL